jgi:hypothetical protein
VSLSSESMIREETPHARQRIAAVSSMALIVTGLLLVALLVFAFVKQFKTDDAFMFYRYVVHMRAGLGISWNADGVHTYGLTSLPWLAVVGVFSLLPINTAHLLTAASCATFIVAAAVMVVVVRRNALSEFFRQPRILIPVLLLPLLLQPNFDLEFMNGMETMLSLLANAVLVAATLQFMKVQSARNAALLGFAGYLAFLVRPDNGLCGALIPVLLWLIWPGARNAYFLVAEACMFSAIAIQLWVADRYFGTPVPLAFYLKSLHGYRGYISPINPGVELARFLLMASPFLLATLVFAARTRRVRFVAIFLIPVAFSSSYLLTVVQIMGTNARYYVPFLPFVIIPAILVVDCWFAEGRRWPTSAPKRQIVRLAALVLLCIAGVYGVSVVIVRHQNSLRVLYPEPKRIVRASAPLGESAVDVRCGLGRLFAQQLPGGTVMAASEVGCLGSSAPQVNIIDVVGLNDREIATSGFSMNRLLDRSPDVIWLPHPPYTWLRAQMWDDPKFLAQYEVYDHAFDYGIAIRKNSTERVLIESAFSRAWSRAYPGKAMEDYRVLGLSS